jgi:hypothetical protein
MSYFQLVLTRVRHAAVAVVALFSFSAPIANAFDFWTFLADLPGPAKMTLNSVIDPITVEMVLGAKVVFDSCQDFSEPGIINCIDTLNKNPDFGNLVGSDATAGIEKALVIYIKIRTDDYLGLLEVAGKPIACILASMIAGGFPVCSALDLLLDIASGFGDAVGAFFAAIGEGLESACEWVGLCEADGKQVSVAEFMYLNFLKSRVNEGVNARMQTTTTPWLQLLSKYRTELGAMMKAHNPTDADFTTAFAAYMVDVIPQWDARVGGYENTVKLQAIASKYYKDNELSLLKKLHGLADAGAVKKALEDDAKVVRKSFDEFKVYDIWAAESPTAKNKPDPFSWADDGTYLKANKIVAAYSDAKKHGCTTKPRANDFSALACQSLIGASACVKTATTINQQHQSAVKVGELCEIGKLVAKSAQEINTCSEIAQAMATDVTKLCTFDSSAHRAQLLQQMKAKDPKGYCSPMGDVVTCDRDVAHTKICLSVMQGDTPPPFKTGLSCKLSRSPAYQMQVNKVAPATQLLQSALLEKMKQQAALLNAGVDPRFQIAPQALAPLVPSVSVAVDPIDPIRLTAHIATEPKHFGYFENELRSASKLPAHSPSDPDNGGEDQVALDIKLQSKPMSTQERELLERIVKGQAQTSPPGLPGGPTVIQNTVINPVINPGDFARFGSVLQSVISMPGISSRLTASDVSALRAGLVATANPKQFKANTAEARAAFVKLQAAAPQAGLQLIQ